MYFFCRKSTRCASVKSSISMNLPCVGTLCLIQAQVLQAEFPMDILGRRCGKSWTVGYVDGCDVKWRVFFGRHFPCISLQQNPRSFSMLVWIWELMLSMVRWHEPPCNKNLMFGVLHTICFSIHYRKHNIIGSACSKNFVKRTQRSWLVLLAWWFVWKYSPTFKRGFEVVAEIRPFADQDLWKPIGLFPRQVDQI